MSSHQFERDAPAEAGLFIAESKREGGEDQPYGRVGKAGQGPSYRAVRRAEAGPRQLCRTEQYKLAEHRHGNDADQPDGSARQRFTDKPDDDSCENGEVIPGILRQTRGRRRQREYDGDGNGRNSPPPICHLSLSRSAVVMGDYGSNTHVAAQALDPGQKPEFEIMIGAAS